MKILPGAFPRLFSILLVSLLLVGCGGGSPSSHGTAGRATFNILWPNRSRLIPAASNSIRINIKRGATVTTTRLVPRPAEGGTSTVTFDSLPVGTLTAIAAAYPQADGSGTVQAQGTLPVNVQDGLNINFSLTMDSTIDHIEVTPPNPTVSAGGTVQLTATAKDSTGAIVLISPSRGQWDSFNKSAATVDSSGLVTARVSGSSTVTYTDTESNKSAGTTVTVNAVTGLSFAAPVVYNVPAAQDNVAALDLDGDGNADVAVGGAKQIGVLYGNGDGTLGAYVQLTTVQADIAVREIADLNGDGRPEIIFMDTLGRLGIIFNQGGRHFADPVFQTVGLASWLSVGDLNGDGHPDIAFSLWGNGGSGSVKILLNNGNGTFTQKSEFSLIGIVEGVCSGDVDGDGIPDLAVSFETSTVDRSGVSIYYGNGDGTFRGGPTYYIGTQNMNTPAFIDLNGDGKKDLTLCHYWGYAVAVLLNNGNGTFTLSNQYHCDGYPLMLRTADFNRDGRTDIAVANAGTSHITVFRNTGGGLYATGVEFPSGGANCRTLYVADFNKDGKPDLVVENEDSSTIAILINNGT